MRLLVSVRSAGEARTAVAGGADIVDAKEPARGSLGPVDLPVLREIAAALAPTMPLSVALGDFEDGIAAGAAAQAAAVVGGRRGPTYLKLGLVGVGGPGRLAEVLGPAVAAARERGSSAIAAAYADHSAAGSPDPFHVLRAAAASGATGVLIDTRTKDGRTLFDWMPAERLAAWVAEGRRAGLVTAVAGSLDLEAMRLVLTCGADVAGVRGAACDGGRSGRLVAARVAALKAALSAPAATSSPPVAPAMSRCSPRSDQPPHGLGLAGE